MNLPNDISRCIGHSMDTPESVCARRDTCLRYLHRADGTPWTWHICPQVPGPCGYYLERRAAPPESSEGVP